MPELQSGNSSNHEENPERRRDSILPLLRLRTELNLRAGFGLFPRQQRRVQRRLKIPGTPAPSA
jgi:hypothetical protein